jgi:hypothetical protein
MSVAMIVRHAVRPVGFAPVLPAMDSRRVERTPSAGLSGFQNAGATATQQQNRCNNQNQHTCKDSRAKHGIANRALTDCGGFTISQAILKTPIRIRCI